MNLATSEGHTEIVELLLSKDCNMNTPTLKVAICVKFAEERLLFKIWDMLE